MSVCNLELGGARERSMAFQRELQGFKENGRELVYAIGIMFGSMIVLGFVAEFITWLMIR